MSYTNFKYFSFNNNKSFTCKIDSDINMISEYNLPILLCWEIGLDFSIAGEDGCIGNWDMYSQIYNAYTGLLYIIPYSISDKFMKGEEVTIYGREVSDKELTDIMDYMNS